MGLDMYLNKYTIKENDVNKLNELNELRAYVEPNIENNFKREYVELLRRKDISNVIEEEISNASKRIDESIEKTKKLISENCSNEYLNKVLCSLEKDKKNLKETITNEYNLEFEKYKKAQENKEKLNYKTIELAYFRKHYDLSKYFENLYYSKGGKEEFNCIPLILTKEDVEELVDNINHDLNIYQYIKDICNKLNLDYDYPFIHDDELANNIIKDFNDYLEENCLSLYFEKCEGLFWGRSNISDWDNSLDIFLKVLEETDWENETVVYSCWW